MIEKGRKFTTVFLVFCLMALSGNLMAKVDKGAKLAVTKTDGQEVTGELITVKKDSLLLLDAETGSDLTVNIKDIDVITIKNKSLILELGVLGFIAGAAARGVMHTEIEKGEVEKEATAHQVQRMFIPGLIGAGIGVAAGAAFGIDKKIQVQGKSDAEIQEIMAKLSKKAREPNFQ